MTDRNVKEPHPGGSAEPPPLLVANDNESDATCRCNEPTPELITIKAMCQMYSLGRTSVYKLIAKNEVRAVRLGRRTLVIRADVDALIERALVEWQQ